MFVDIDGFAAKKLGRKVSLRPDWDDIRDTVMRQCVEAKFANLYLASKLKQITEDIVEENTWGDTYWGVCNGKGRNMLGKILMDVRNTLLR